jgi:hypothetical protein
MSIKGSMHAVKKNNYLLKNASVIFKEVLYNCTYCSSCQLYIGK